jgi:adenine phosphoribosyltransferase
MTTGERGATLADRLAERLRVVPDFPEPGVQFQDVTPILADAELLAEAVSAMSAPWRGAGVTHVVGIESRGFIFGAPVALALGAGFVPIRKPGKLPWRRAGREYALEYGSAALELHLGEVPVGTRVLLVDDVLATGGTLEASLGLLGDAGLAIAGVSVVLEIAALNGRARLGPVPFHALQQV